MLNTLLSGTIARLRASKDDRVHLEEMGDWNGLTGEEVAKVLRKAGLKTKSVRKLGKVARGYMRLDLLELEDRLEREAKGQSEEPLRDWFCVPCGELFEARAAQCPNGEQHDVHVVLNKAPGVMGVRTKNKDDVLRNLVESAGGTDYTNTRDTAKVAMDSMWATPGGGYNVGAALRNIYPQMKNAPDSMMTMPAMPGKNTVAPQDHFSVADGSGVGMEKVLPKASMKKPTFIDPKLRDTTNVRKLAGLA